VGTQKGTVHKRSGTRWDSPVLLGWILWGNLRWLGVRRSVVGRGAPYVLGLGFVVRL
jgi:hypothetical protein